MKDFQHEKTVFTSLNGDLVTTNLPFFSSVSFLARGESNRIHWSESRILFESTGALTFSSSLLEEKRNKQPKIPKITFKKNIFQFGVKWEKKIRREKIVRNLSSSSIEKRWNRNCLWILFFTMPSDCASSETQLVRYFCLSPTYLSLVLIYGALANSIWRSFFQLQTIRREGRKKNEFFSTKLL
jgi:hypothetical protein